MRALGWVPPPAGRAVATVSVNLAYHPLPNQAMCVVGPFHYPHKFVTQDASKTHIAPYNLDIGITKPSQLCSNQSFTGWRSGDRDIGSIVEDTIKV
jgi:hypothetical protein